jgi:hypothetical protein
MNESMSILLATTILALGGLGLYMYKSSEDEQKGGDSEYDEDGIFGTYSFFDWGNKTENNYDDNNDEINSIEDNLVKYEEDYKPRKKGGKTQRNRRTSGSSKRRYN